MTTILNNYDEVLMVIGNTFQRQRTIGLYPSVQRALDALKDLYKNTVWCELNEAVKVYGVITESNGYKHSVKEPLLVAKESDFWDGKKPQIMEILPGREC